MRRKKGNNYWIIIMTSLVLVFIIVLAVVIGNNNSGLYTLELKGESNVVVYKNGSYEDPGAKVYDKNNNDYSDKIVVESNLDLKKTGQYEITYKYEGAYVKRIVKVIEKKEDNSTNNVTQKGETIISLKGNETVYIDLNGNYKEEGFSVVDSVDGNIKKYAKVTHNIDNTKEGTYQIVYTVKNSSGVTTSVKRNVVVMSVDLDVSLDTNYYINGDVSIKVSTSDEYFDYLVLPNGSNSSEKSLSYTVSENGTYTFKLVNKMGITKEKSIVVGNIDRVNPTGACSGYFKDGYSFIDVVGSDNLGISSYVVDGKRYTTNSIKLNKEVSNVSVDIYDMANNKVTISCVLADKNDFISSDKSITFSYEFKTDSDLAYGLYTPSTAASGKKTPLIIWLHGSGSVGAEHSRFKSNFLSYMKDWKLEGFNAYIVCPLLKHGSWNNQPNKARVYTLVDKILKEKNIDTDKIILAGHSMGAQGIFNIADGKSDFYSALVFMSPYKATPSTIDINQFKNVPLIGYVGTIEAGEDETSYKYATKTFSNTYGRDKMIIINSNHGNLPKKVFNIDENKDNKSDLIEWMLKQ